MNHCINSSIKKFISVLKDVGVLDNAHCSCAVGCNCEITLNYMLCQLILWQLWYQRCASNCYGPPSLKHYQWNSDSPNRHHLPHTVFMIMINFFSKYNIIIKNNRTGYCRIKTCPVFNTNWILNIFLLCKKCLTLLLHLNTVY